MFYIGVNLSTNPLREKYVTAIVADSDKENKERKLNTLIPYVRFSIVLATELPK